MTTITVALGDRSYPVVIEPGLLARAADHLAPLARERPLVIVADANVRAHLHTLEASLRAAGIATEAVIVPAGEGAKSWASLEKLCDRLLDLGVERGDYVVALGGGVIGDLVGFAAAILKRGCGFVQIPTTLLAQVDSSVGGKTGINARAGKNLIGAFHQPRLVLIDPNVLATLSPRELRAGYAEVVKYGLIDDADFYSECEDWHHVILTDDRNFSAEFLADMIEHCVRAKTRIVAADPNEMIDVRALLNLGHTFGHALEAEAGYDGTLLHGEAVAAGCALAFRYSVRLGLCPAADAERVATHFRIVGLPYGLHGVAASGARLVDHMRHDKKASGGVLPFLLARGIGRTFLDRTVDLADIAAFLDGEPR